MKKIVFTTLLTLLGLNISAQESETAYNFLRLPVSAHVAALGGDNITLTDDDPSIIFHNPSLIYYVGNNSIGLNYMTYMEGAKTASASFIKIANDRASWGLMGQYMDYGSMKETTYDNTQTGEFNARDAMLGGTFSYALSNRIQGGVSAKLITSHIASYKSTAVGIDLGLSYTDSIGHLTVGLVAKNLGGMIDSYEEEFERIPFDLQVGVTKRLTNSPLRFSLTLTRLTDWDQSLLRHLNVGADLLLGSNVYVAAGFNFRQAHEMKISDDEGSTAHGAGLSLGAGITLERLKLHIGYAKYHVSANSLLFNVAYQL